MSTTSSRRGYAGEAPIEAMLKLNGRHGVYRPRAGRARDEGDLGGVPLVISAKNHGRMELSTWVNELESQCVNAGVSSGVVWHKRRGRGHPLDWYVTTSGRLFLPLLDLAYEHWGVRVG